MAGEERTMHGRRLAVALALALVAGCDGAPGGDGGHPVEPPAGDAAVADAALPDGVALGGSIDAAAADTAVADAAVIDAPAVDATVAVDAGIDGPADAMYPPSTSCSGSPAPGWISTAWTSDQSSGWGETVRAEATWTLADTAGCVDRYRPSGTVTTGRRSGSCGLTLEPASAAIAATDGELIVDRGTEPPSFRLEGTTTWQALERCDEDGTEIVRTVGGRWAWVLGTVDAGRAAAGLENREVVISSHFELRRSDLPPPPVVCTTPPVAGWRSTTREQGDLSSIDWVLDATVGCVDTYRVVGGTAWVLPDSCTYAPSWSPVAAADGVLRVDRTIWPPRFTLEGRTVWATIRTCPNQAGVLVSVPGHVGVRWNQLGGTVAGRHFDVTMAADYRVARWTLTASE